MRGGLVERPPPRRIHPGGWLREMMLVVTASPWPAVRTDVMSGAFGASFPANDPVQAAPVPTLPTQDVLSKAVSVTFSLMKPTSTFT